MKMSRTSSPRDRRSSFTGGLTLPSDHQPDLALLAARGGKALKQFEATQANPQVQMQVARSLPTAASGRTMAALAADTASASEDERTSAAVSTLVGDFHDRFWLPRDAAGDVAASSAASAAALSSDPGQRSVAAHLYAVRTTQRLVKQVRDRLLPPPARLIAACASARFLQSAGDAQLTGLSSHASLGGALSRSVFQVLATVRHRAPAEPAFGANTSFGIELEAAVGAAVHAELCRVFDEVSQVNALLVSARAVDSRRVGGNGEGEGRAALPPQPQPIAPRSKDPGARSKRNSKDPGASNDEAYRQAQERIYALERQVASLQHQLRTQFQASVEEDQAVAPG